MMDWFRLNTAHQTSGNQHDINLQKAGLEIVFLREKSPCVHVPYILQINK